MAKTVSLAQAAADFREMGAAIEWLKGEITTAQFDADDPASIEAAIAAMEQSIDEKVGLQRDNPILDRMIRGLKDTYRRGILEKAAAARMAKTDDGAGP